MLGPLGLRLAPVPALSPEPQPDPGGGAHHSWQQSLLSPYPAVWWQ